MPLPSLAEHIIGHPTASPRRVRLDAHHAHNGQQFRSVLIARSVESAKTEMVELVLELLPQVASGRVAATHEHVAMIRVHNLGPGSPERERQMIR